MKHIHTFESFLNEAELNEAKRTKKISIPAKKATVINKIEKDNPWSRGKKIAEVIEKNWDDIVDTAKKLSYQQELVDELAKKDYMIAQSAERHLDVHHMISTVVENYF